VFWLGRTACVEFSLGSNGAGAGEFRPRGSSGGAEAMAELLRLMQNSNTRIRDREVARTAVQLYMPSSELSCVYQYDGGLLLTRQADRSRLG
jgi:hypothetical protein